MNPTTFPPIPFETAREARVTFRKPNPYLVIGDRADVLFEGLSLEGTASQSEKMAHRFSMLYLTTIFQHFESLSDRMAVDALRNRLDWQYAMHASAKPVSIETSTLCEFRTVLHFDALKKQNLQELLGRLAAIPQVMQHLYFSTEAEQVLEHVCRISRLEEIWEAMNQILEILAIRYPDWLRTHSLPYWYERYGFNHRKLNLKTNRQAQIIFAQEVGGDGFYIMDEITNSASEDLMNLPEVYLLRKIWSGQFDREKGRVSWRIEGCASCSFSGHVRKGI